MVKRSIILIVLICALGLAVWTVLCKSAKHEAFFGASQKYDMTHGQEMRPRW